MAGSGPACPWRSFPNSSLKAPMRRSPNHRFFLRHRRFSSSSQFQAYVVNHICSICFWSFPDRRKVVDDVCLVGRCHVVMSCLPRCWLKLCFRICGALVCVCVCVCVLVSVFLCVCARVLCLPKLSLRFEKRTLLTLFRRRQGYCRFQGEKHRATPVHGKKNLGKRQTWA